VSQSRRERREQARQLAKELLSSGQSRHAGFDFSVLGGPVLAIILFLLDGKIGSVWAVIFLLTIFGCLLYSFFKLKWIRDAIPGWQKWRRAAILLVGIILVVGAFGYYIWPAPSRLAAAYIADHNLSITGAKYSAVVTVRGSDNAAPYINKNHVVLLIRSPDNTISANTDKTVDLSNDFPIPQPGRAETIEVPLGAGTIARFHRTQWLDFYLLMVPNGVEHSDLHTLMDIGDRGGIGLDYKGIGMEQR
jgi:hypothetical protein